MHFIMMRDNFLIEEIADRDPLALTDKTGTLRLEV